MVLNIFKASISYVTIYYAAMTTITWLVNHHRHTQPVDRLSPADDHRTSSLQDGISCCGGSETLCAQIEIAQVRRKAEVLRWFFSDFLVFFHILLNLFTRKKAGEK